MSSEAQRLIGISLTKIAQSRTHRGGVSLHKNLLIATVLQKARYIFMEEAYNMVHYQQRAAAPVQQLHHHHHQPTQQQQQQVQTHPVNAQQRRQEPEEDEDMVGLTVEEAGIDQTAPECASLHDCSPNQSQTHAQSQSGCVRCATNQTLDKTKDKENQPPGYHNEQLTYLDLDKTPSVLKERGASNAATTSASPICLKRRRAVSEWETEEAVQSILPKRRCSAAATADDDDSVFLDNAAQLAESAQRATCKKSDDAPGSPMDSIDRITSLVSIFSFGMTSSPPTADGATGNGKLSTASRAVSTTPDLCSAQAKEGDAIQQRPFLAMTV